MIGEEVKHERKCEKSGKRGVGNAPGKIEVITAPEACLDRTERLPKF